MVQIWIGLPTSENDTLRKILSFQLIFWCEDFVETHSFRRVSSINLKICGNCLFQQNFHIRKPDEITVFYAPRKPSLYK